MAVKLRTGREKEVRRCLRCFQCVNEMYQHGRLFCAINPESGKDREILSHHCVPEKKHVLVAGGGIAGMEAAITAAENGHKVTLCEKTDRLGGVLLCETGVYFKTRVGEYIERQKYMIGKKGIEVRLNTPVTPELVDEIKPDALIVAIGGIELGIYLKELGKDISIIEALESVDQGIYTPKIKENSLEIVAGTKAKEIRADGVLCDTSDGEKLFPADTVVLALGVKPLWEEVDALSSFAGEFYQAGDCREPRSIIAATGEAWTMANLIGRY